MPCEGIPLIVQFPRNFYLVHVVWGDKARPVIGCIGRVFYFTLRKIRAPFKFPPENGSPHAPFTS